MCKLYPNPVPKLMLGPPSPFFLFPCLLSSTDQFRRSARIVIEADRRDKARRRDGARDEEMCPPVACLAADIEDHPACSSSVNGPIRPRSGEVGRSSTCSLPVIAAAASPRRSSIHAAVVGFAYFGLDLSRKRSRRAASMSPTRLSSRWNGKIRPRIRRGPSPPRPPAWRKSPVRPVVVLGWEEALAQARR